MIVLLKALQATLLEKIVPVAGSVSKEGTITKPHFARRKVRAPEARAPHVVDKPEPSAKPKTRKAAAREQAAIGDLFDMPAVKAPPKDESPAPDAPAAKPRASRKPRRQDAVPPVATAAVNYDQPFDPDKVPDFGVPAGTSKERRREINAEAARIIEDGGDISPEQRATLRQYSGNGGCGDSLNEFYTDPKVSAAMWAVLRNMGLPEGAEVLEPSCATGVFLETAPAGVRVTGVEMDPTSAKIGAVLHPAHEVENASLERFAVHDTRQFDAVVGNAPFGLRGSLIKDDKPNLKTAEAYFMDTSLDKTKPGGIVAMIVPTGILDNKGTRAVRERLLRKGEFLGAMRMPNTAFEHSHTEVTTDIVFFRKRPQDVANALMTVKQATLQKLGVWDEEYLAGDYFTGRGAPNVLGTMTEGWRAKAGMGDDITVEGSMIGVPEAVAGFKPDEPAPSPDMASVLEAIGPDDAAKARAAGAALKIPYEHGKRGDTKTVDGVEYILEGDPLRWHRVDEFLQTKAVTDAQDLSVLIENAMNGNRAPDLADKVRAYVDEHGIPSKNYDLQIAARADKSIYRLIGAVKPDGTLSDVVEHREHAVVESSFDAAAQSLSLEIGHFTPEQVAGRWGGGDAETALDHLYASPDYALDPASMTWTSVDNYLSGELWPKLDQAKAALAEDGKAEDKAKYERQSKLIEETIAPKLLEDVEIALNSAFVPLPVIAAFFNDKKAEMAAEGNAYVADRPDLVITFDKGVYHLEGGLYDTALLGKYLNRTGVKKDDLPQIDKWNAEFKAWLCSSKFRDEIEDLYNRKFRGFRQRAYSDTPLDIPGLNAEGLKSYQWSGLRWALEAGKGIIAADVGLGKTARGLMLARAAVASGRAHKPMIIVPKSVLANWVAEAEKWFPGSNVMTIGETYTKDKDGNLKGRQDSAAERNRKYHDLTQNDYDFILISQPAWNDLDVDPETKFNYSEDDFWVQRGDALGNAGDKRVNKIRESYKQHMAQREFQNRTDAIYFNDLGVDMLIGDEFHAFKNLYAARNRFGQQPKFLGGQGLSNRALDMNFKSRWVREHNGGKNVYGLTATPTKNSPLEIYSMLSHIAPEAFSNIGVRNSEEFLDRFCEFRTENILSTSGKIEEALVTVGFKNLDELREIMRRYIDRKTAEDVGLVLPTRDDRMHTVDMTPQQQAVYEELRELAAQSGKKDATGDAHIFSIMDKMGKAAMDLELYDPAYKGSDSPKYHAAADEIANGAKDGGQVVFAENIAVHDKMVAALVAKGIPRDRIAIFNAKVAESSAKRQAITDAFNAGKLDVVIGNSTMSEGVNLQKRTTDIHHMDLPWEPASVQQRNGRGLRQGNLKESVRIHTYLAKGSFDGYRYQCLLAKKNWQDLLWNGGDRVENLAREGNISREDMLIMLAADPEKARETMTANKEMAQKKFEASKFSDAAAEFVSFQEMKRSYSGLKNKKTNSAERLRVRMDRARVNLEANEWFKAKHALDAKTPVLLDPQTGTAFEDGISFEAPATVNGGGKYVVTGVQPMAGAIHVRRYGEANASPLTFTLDMLKDGIKPFRYDEAAEKAEIGRAMEQAMKANVSTVKEPKDLHGMPASLIESSYEPIQRQMKDAIKNYQRHTYGGIGFIAKDGTPVASESYSAQDYVDTHDVMVPVPDHHRKALAAYVADERAKEFRMEYPSSSGRRGSHKSNPMFVSTYPGKYGSRTNQWASLGDEVFGAGFAKEAHGVFERAQNEAARRAKTTTEALDAVAPTVTVEYGKVRWPKRGLAVLYARAKKEGKLDEPLSSLIPLKGGDGWDKSRPRWPAELFFAQERGGYIGRGENVSAMPVRKALRTLAASNGFKDLAAAMAAGHHDKDEAVKDLMRLGTDDKHAIAGLRHVLDKNPELRERKLDEFYNSPHHASGTLGRYVDDIGDSEDDGGQRNAA